MSIKIEFQCDGCHVMADPVLSPRPEFHGFNGKNYGFGVRSFPSIADQAPEGWVAYDPYTQCTYCQKCWAEIEGEDEVFNPADQQSRMYDNEVVK